MLPEDTFGLVQRYCRIGLAVIPVRGKRPIFEDWVQRATKDENVALQWWKQSPQDNVGIVLGPPSGAVVLDFDLRHGGMDTLETIESKYGFQDTWRAHTGGGGAHLWYADPNFAMRTIMDFFPGCECRGLGAQVVVPPSIHPITHQPYIWDMMDDHLTREFLLPLPQWAIERGLQQPGARTEARKRAERPPEKIGQGGRHRTMVSMAGTMRHRLAATEDEIDAYLQVFNRKRCDPPYEAGHVAQIAKSMMRYQPDDPRLVQSVSRLYARLKEQAAVDQQFADKYQPLTGEQILSGNYHAPETVIEGMVHEGLSILAGPPKIGKSYLTMQKAIGVSLGVPLFGELAIARAGKVAYLSLEESPAQTNKKLKQLRMEPGAESLSNIDFYYQCPKLAHGALDVLRNIIEQTVPTMVVIDSLRSISEADGRGNVADREYNEVKSLADLAKRLKTAVVLIHHTAKRAQGDSLVDSFAGSHGITAAGDCLMRLAPEGGIFILEGTGREIEEFRFALTRDIKGGTGWQLKAKGEESRNTAEREEIFTYLREEGSKKPAQIAKDLGKNQGAVRRLLMKMREASQVMKQADGSYVHVGTEL